MKAFKIDTDGIIEVDLADDFVTTSDFDWDAFSLDAEHDVWVADEGLFTTGVGLARIGSNPMAPLPAYVLGRERDRTIAATISIDELRPMVTLQGRMPMTASVRPE